MAAKVQVKLIISHDELSDIGVAIDADGDLVIDQCDYKVICHREVWLLLKDAVDRLFAEHEKTKEAQEG